MNGKETLRPTFPYANDHPYPRVTYGLPFYEACSIHVKEMFRSQRTYVIASKTLSIQTNVLNQLQEALGDNLVGTWIGIKPHTPLKELIPIMDDMKARRADGLITLGGGSLSDGGKAITYVSLLVPFARYHSLKSTGPCK